MSIPKNLNVKIIDISEHNKKEKLQKAIKNISKQLKIPTTIKTKIDNKEKHPFIAQKELYALYETRFNNLLEDLYSRLCSTLGLNISNTLKKSIALNAPKLLPGEILWNPETGKPIAQTELDALLLSIDKFMNRDPFKKEFTISQSAVSRMIANMRKTTEMKELRKKTLAEIKYKKTLWSDISTYEVLNDLFPDNYDRLKFRERVVGNYIQDVTQEAKSGIRNILDNGFLSGKSKNEISQDLLDKFGSLNKNWSRIVDTEATNIFNAEYIGEQISETEPGEPVYFIRREYNDNKTCSFCKGAEDTVIAKWSDMPLSDDKIDDPYASIAIWSGKNNYGTSKSDWQWSEGAVHPYCRGFWDRYYPEIGEIKL